MKGIKDKLLHKAGKVLLGYLVTVLCKSLRIEYKNYIQVEKLIGENKKFISAFWHGTMLIPWYVFRNKNTAALVSKSKDGELLARVLAKWEYDVVRGSSRDGGKAAFDKIVDIAKSDKSIALTPDGPTGPPFKMKAGTVVAAKRSGLPIVLVGVRCESSYRLNSWDNFEIPKPFSKVRLDFSEPVYISNELSRDEVSEKIAECELLLNQLQKGSDIID